MKLHRTLIALKNKKNQNSIRKMIIEEIEKDVVGPWGGPEETFHLYPEKEYLAGVLYPQDTQISDLEIENDEGEDEDAQAENVYANVGFRPSSFGLTCRITSKAETIKVVLTYGRYYKQPRTPEHYTTFTRKPFSETFILDLKKPGKPSAPKSDPLIEIRYAVLESKNFSDSKVLNVYLVNMAKPSSKTIVKNCIFQPEIRISSTDGSDIIVDDRSYLEKSDSSDYDSQMFSLLFNKEKNFGMGHGCAVVWDDDKVHDNKISEIFTSFCPRESVNLISPSRIDFMGADMKELYSVKDFSKYSVMLFPIIAKYDEWILETEKKINDGTTVQLDMKPIAMQQLSECKNARQRIARGIEIISKSGSKEGEAFRFANKVIALQQTRGKWALENIKNGKVEAMPPLDAKGTWRLFQIAFILLNIESIANKGSEDRKKADLLWFPTGGGKTEAYLGIIAFTIALRRLSGYSAEKEACMPISYGVSVIMRYTLRLLTVQQFQRASTFMCACEHERKQDEKKWGTQPFYVGLWVGGSVTPNKLTEGKASAKVAVEKAKNERRINQVEFNPFQLLYCPWCGAKLNHHCGEIGGQPEQFRLYCSRAACEFSKDNCKKNPDHSLPILVVDEDIYKRCPSLIISTVDKFAQISWEKNTRSIFGMVDSYCHVCGFFDSNVPFNENVPTAHNHTSQKYTGDGPCAFKIGQLIPPELIVQDELHLISGPLGTMAGLYETAINYLCTDECGHKPKIIASTATTKSADAQIQKLFNVDETKIFPPQAITFGDTFFSEVKNDEESKKIYFGICATGKSGLTVLGRVSAAILRKVRFIEENLETEFKDFTTDDLDDYYTLVSYFNSIREIGGGDKTYSDSVPNYIKRVMAFENLGRPSSSKDSEQKTGTLSSGIDESDESEDSVISNLDSPVESLPGPKPEPEAEESNLKNARKRPYTLTKLETKELTGRAKSGEIPETLATLTQGIGEVDRPVDVLMATNMLSVGVDIQRLGVMMVNGQPKNHSEYIQATGRIGRSSPGLIVTLYSYLKPRDLSHYENFKYYHKTFYKNIESVSLTPFSTRARDIGLFGIFVGMIRNKITFLASNKSAKDFNPEDERYKNILGKIKSQILSRVECVENKESEGTKSELENLVRKWRNYITEAKENAKPLIYKDSGSEFAGESESRQIYLMKRDLSKDNQKIPVPTSLRDAEPDQRMFYSKGKEEEGSE